MTLDTTTYVLLGLLLLLAVALFTVFGSGFRRWRKGETLVSAIARPHAHPVMRTATATMPAAVPSQRALEEVDPAPLVDEEPVQKVSLPEPARAQAVTVEIVAPTGAHSNSESVRGEVIRLVEGTLSGLMDEVPQSAGAISTVEVLLADVAAHDLDRVKAIGLDVESSASNERAMWQGYVGIVNTHAASVKRSGSREGERAILLVKSAIVTAAAGKGVVL